MACKVTQQKKLCLCIFNMFKQDAHIFTLKHNLSLHITEKIMQNYANRPTRLSGALIAVGPLYMI